MTDLKPMERELIAEPRERIIQGGGYGEPRPSSSG
jgi:hypothetical protein